MATGRVNPFALQEQAVEWVKVTVGRENGGSGDVCGRGDLEIIFAEGEAVADAMFVNHSIGVHDVEERKRYDGESIEQNV